MIKMLRARFTKLKTDMAEMTFPEKVDHIWTYYKELIFTFGILLFLVVALLSSVIHNLTTTTAFHGVLMNQNLTDSGNSYLTDTFHEKLDLDDNAFVTVESIDYAHSGDQEMSSVNYVRMMTLLAQIDTQSIDYMLVDEKGLTLLPPEDYCLDLREALGEEALASIPEEKLRYARIEGEEASFPAAINVTDLPFVQKHLGSKGDVWLIFICNTAHKDTCRLFWQHFQLWTE